MIFISHSSKDIALVELFNQFLTSLGVKKEDIFCSSINGQGVENGTRIADAVLKHLKDSNLIIYFVTNHFLKSPYCTQELGIGWSLNNEKIMFIYKADDVRPDEIKGFVSSDYKYSQLNSDGLSELCDKLIELKYGISEKHKIINGSINQFLNSARKVISLLVETKDLSEEEADKRLVKKLETQYEDLAVGAKAILANLYFSNDGVCYYRINNGVVQSLVTKFFIRRVTTLSTGDLFFAYELQPWAHEFIKKNKTIQEELKSIGKRGCIPTTPEW